MPGAAHSLAAIPLLTGPSAIHELPSLRRALGGGPRLLVKRDDGIGFACGGNKVRKMALVAAAALRDGADTLITCGGRQSNHARVTAITAAHLGLRCILVLNAEDEIAARAPTGNLLLDTLAGAEIRFVRTRDERDPTMQAAAEDVRRSGGRPAIIPLGASTPLGAAAFVSAIDELTRQIEPPTAIVHASSSGGTQAGLVAGYVLAGLPTRVIGISADESRASLSATVNHLLAGLPPLLRLDDFHFDRAVVEVDDRFIGEGYGVPTPASREALELALRCEGFLLDHTYTAKAMAGLIAHVRAGAFTEADTVLFWHTGGQPGLFA